MFGRAVDLRLIRGDDHYHEVIEGVLRRAQVSLWISTANVKELHVQAPVGTRARARGRYISIVSVLDDLSRAGVEVRVLHAGTPSRRFRSSAAAADPGFEMRQCPRVHLKMIAVDGSLLYLGSANLTGAGLGAKAEGRRNFEAGILTDDELLLDEMQGTFDDIWRGAQCGGCRLRGECPAPLDMDRSA